MATYKNISIDQGSSFYLEMTATDQLGAAIDLTGSTGSSQLRKSYYTSDSIDFSVGRTGGTGGFFLRLPAATSATADAGRYVYDVNFAWNDGTVKRVKQGIATIDPRATR